MKWTIKFIEKIVVKCILYRNRDIINGKKIWWRDDDSFEINESLERLFYFQKDINLDVYLSVIPSKITKDFIKYIKKIDGAFVFPHGYAHINKSGKTSLLNEFPNERNYNEMLYEISNGVNKLKNMLPKKYLPVFVPPWEHYSEKLLEILPTIGINTISLSGKLADLPSGINQVNPQINFHSYKNVTAKEYIVKHKSLIEICKEIVFVMKSNGKHRFIGFLTHHKDMNNRDWENFKFINSALFQLGFERLSNEEMIDYIYGN